MPAYKWKEAAILWVDQFLLLPGATGLSLIILVSLHVALMKTENQCSSVFGPVKDTPAFRPKAQRNALANVLPALSQSGSSE